MQFAVDNKDILNKYITENKSVRELAEELGSNKNRVFRALKFLKIPLRTNGESQKIAVEKGIREHPTKGKKRSTEVKEKISEKVSQKWQDKPLEEKEVIRKKQRDKWNNMTPAEKEHLQKLAHEAIRKSGVEGSKIEQAVMEGLEAENYGPLHHWNPIEKTKLEVDILLPALNIAIEIDGPSHFLPIWGQENLDKTQAADTEKNGILVSNGFCVIRVMYNIKHISDKVKRDTVSAIVEAVKKVEEKFPPLHQRVIYLELGKD